jgi:uncharacterized protein YbgA (DUF1722 family)/uncharacterized protein YbbK (DUF523 family)
MYTGETVVMGEIKVGISACLLGQPVRYDGGHKLDRFLAGTLGRYVTFVPVCPEVESGMGIPREAMRLTGDPRHPRLVTIRSGRDMTEQVKEWGRRRVRELESERLCGFIFKSRSPSSGMERVKVYDGHGVPAPVGVGVWARIFMDRFPDIPVEEEGRLNDPVLRESFIERIFVLKRWRESQEGGMTPGGLVRFHTRHKLLLMAHSPELYREMGKVVAGAGSSRIEEVSREYFHLLNRCLRMKATLKKNRNVLQHLMGYFKKQLSPDEKQEILEIIDGYAKGHYPLIVPVTLCNHFVRKYRQSYLQEQVYLNPHPVELQLRNHV